MTRASPKTLHHHYNQAYHEKVLVCAFSQKGTWAERGPGTLKEVRGIFHKTKPYARLFLSTALINLVRKICIIFKKGMKPNLNIHRLSSKDCASLDISTVRHNRAKRNLTIKGVLGIKYFIF